MARRARHQELVSRAQHLPPEHRAALMMAGFVAGMMWFVLEAVWLGWLGIIAVRVVRRRHLGMSRAAREGIGLPGLVGIAVIQMVLWRFRAILRRLIPQPTTEGDDN